MNYRGFSRKVYKVASGGVRLVKLVIGLSVAVCFTAVAAFLAIYLYFARDLPDIKKLDDYKPQVISEAFSDDGTRIGEFWLECRMFLPYDEIPKRVVQAFIDSEDSRYFGHKGVDVRSIFRAFIANLKAGEVRQGGSTITQQITRSLLLSREKTLTRKVREALLATRLDRYLTKEQILTLYLNQIYLGNRAYGVAAAARNYFHKPLSELTLGETALIAGMPSAPTSFSPINDPAEARKRQVHVITRMKEEHHITEKEARDALNENFDIYFAGTDKEFLVSDAAYFTEHVRRLVKEHYGDEFLYNGGLKIYTTLNLPMQSAAVTAVRHGIETMDRRQGWRGPIEHIAPEDIEKKAAEIEGAILRKQEGRKMQWPPGSPPRPRSEIKFTAGERYKAVVTGISGKDVEFRIGDTAGVIGPKGYAWAKAFTTEWLGYEGASYVSDPKNILKAGDVIYVRRADDGSFALAQEPLIESALMAMELRNGHVKAMVGGYDFSRSEFNRATQALRQPGSSFKPFVYSAALDKGYTFRSVIVDEPVAYRVGNEVWSPKNYGNKFNGPTTFRNAITFSRNVPTVKITYDIGTHYLTAYLRKMGLTTHVEKYLSMALGANAVYLYDMVQAYSVFPNGGVFRPAIAVTKIEDRFGKVLEEESLPNSPPKEEAADETASDEKVLAELKPPKRKISEGELNTALFSQGYKAIERDKLKLTDLELKTLYGAGIPGGLVITPQTAYLMVDLFKGIVQGGTGTRARALERPAGGKTGTTNDESDNWFIGFVPQLTAGVWVGFDEIRKIGKGATGGNTAAPIFVEFMKEAVKDMEPLDFAKPEGFPEGDIAGITGGSSVFGSRHIQAPISYRGGADRAGEFFEDDFESSSSRRAPAPLQAPTPHPDSEEGTF